MWIRIWLEKMSKSFFSVGFRGVPGKKVARVTAWVYCRETYYAHCSGLSVANTLLFPTAINQTDIRLINSNYYHLLYIVVVHVHSECTIVSY